ncbi:MAG: CocE/NonD family hydrolase [bacterium]
MKNLIKPRQFFNATVLLLAVVSSMLATDISYAYTKKSVMVPMRDGINLATDIFFPENKKGKLPVILVRTPYGRKVWSDIIAPIIGREQFIWAVQDTRGRFDSEGVSTAFIDDSLDGYDTVEWFASQEWCNGKIGTAGISAMGITQYAMDKTQPPHLACQHVMAASPSLYHVAAYQGGGFLRSLVFGWLLGNEFSTHILKLMLANPDYNGLWEIMDLTSDYDKVNIPIMHMAGWYDMFLKGNLDAFTGLLKKGAGGARGRQRLVIGPWTHEGFLALAGTKQGELTYPANSAYNFSKISAWFQECLTGKNEGFLDGPAVRYYVMGDPEDPTAPGNEWRKSDVWPIPAKITPFYFNKNGTLDTAAATSQDDTLSFIDDPANPVPTIGGANLNLPAGPKDQRPIEGRKDVLVFTTPPLKEPVEITGHIVAKLLFTTDVVDTDFTVRLTDVYPDGRSMLLTDGIARASHRESDRYRVPLVPGELYELTVDMWATSIIINKGHSIRVIVAGSNFPRFDVNLHNGKYFDIQPNEIEDAIKKGINSYIKKPDLSADYKVAHNTLYVSSEHPSHILLPIVTNGSIK